MEGRADGDRLVRMGMGMIGTGRGGVSGRWMPCCVRDPRNRIVGASRVRIPYFLLFVISNFSSLFCPILPCLGVLWRLGGGLGEGLDGLGFILGGLGCVSGGVRQARWFFCLARCSRSFARLRWVLPMSRMCDWAWMGKGRERGGPNG